MNILIINQPLSNRGDEAAHRSLLRALDKEFSQSKITVLFVNEKNEDIQDFIVKSLNITYQNIIGISRGLARLQHWSLKLNMIFLLLLHPVIRKYVGYIKRADIVICAPGGICMGGFQNWTHIFYISLALKYNKDVFYYSRSIGPFPEITNDNRIFKKKSMDILRRLKFLSLRDAKSIETAEQLGFNCIHSIDTVFLDTPDNEIPVEILNIINNEKFIVVVPNSLTWHIAYKNRKQEDIDAFYVEILRILLAKNIKVLMLPQLSQYVSYSEPDYSYFHKLKTLLGNNNVFVVKDTCGSDIQQKIIEKADFVIGSRYHSIVFAINNCTPFISLSYEHKMTGLLELLNLQEREVNISNIGGGNFDKELALLKIKQLLEMNYPNIKEVKEVAHKIAAETFGSFKECLNYNLYTDEKE
jgi:colanic acid/amylovoran biosynthesis protein